MLPYTDHRREALRADVAAFAAGLPRHEIPLDRPGALEAFAALSQAGVLANIVPGQFGGKAEQVEALSLVVVREALAGMSGVHDVLFAVQGLAAHPLAAAGSPAVGQRWLPALAQGLAIGAFAATEAEAGSDLHAMTTTATRDGDAYVLNGHKIFISNAGLADVYVVFAKHPSTETGAPVGLSAFVVVRRFAAMAKLHATEATCATVDQALQLHGAEIQRLLIARTYLGGH